MRRERAKTGSYIATWLFKNKIFSQACQNSGFEISDHFGEATEMVSIVSKAHPSSDDRYRTFLDEEKDRIEEMRSLSEE